MLAQTRLIRKLDSLLQTDLTGFIRLREPIDITSFTGWLKGQTLYPRIYWHARERDREFAALGVLREIRDAEQLAALSGQPKPAAGSWPRTATSTCCSWWQAARTRGRNRWSKQRCTWSGTANG